MGGPSHDVASMLASMQVTRIPGVYCVVSVDGATISSCERSTIEAAAIAFVREPEGCTFVVPAETARDHGLTSMFDGAWLTVSVWSALDAVGLTAGLSATLAAHGIACNVFAGAFHDHLLVPADRADQAIDVLQARPAAD